MLPSWALTVRDTSVAFRPVHLPGQLSVDTTRVTSSRGLLPRPARRLLDLDAQLERSYDRYASCAMLAAAARIQVTDGTSRPVGGTRRSMEEDPANDTRRPTRRRRPRNAARQAALHHNSRPLFSGVDEQGRYVSAQDDGASCRRCCCCTRHKSWWRAAYSQRRARGDGRREPANATDIELGHKLGAARLNRYPVLKYGVRSLHEACGGARRTVHLHNLRSDYIPSTSREIGPAPRRTGRH